jgi:glycine hydroxymethyltransferase
VRKLVNKAATDLKVEKHGYPHFYYVDDKAESKAEQVALEISGEHALHYVSYVFSADVNDLSSGKTLDAKLVTPLKEIEGMLSVVDPHKFTFSIAAADFGLAATFLRDLSDGYIAFDGGLPRRIPGPIIITESKEKAAVKGDSSAFAEKPYFIGQKPVSSPALPEFKWEEKEPSELFKTKLNDLHKELGAKMVPFAGWEMPVWYSSVVEEHLATREAAGLFDVSHMGVFQAEGPWASLFLDSVCGNDIGSLAVGESCYTHFLDPDSNVIDDTLVYHRGTDVYLVVVNASNDLKDWTWLNAVKDGKVLIDRSQPWVKAFGRNVTLRNLRDPKAGKDMRVDIALQGPKSRDILLSLGADAKISKKIKALKRTELCEAVVGGFDLVVSRTGYTGEKMAFELFVHPDKAVELWKALMAAGGPLGLKPCGLGARDSLRTEAGLPLYGHEMGGELNLGVSEAGFGSYVKVYKPWFIGREAYLAREAKRTGVVARFRFTDKAVRMAHNGDPVLDAKGKVIGEVTSCAVDKEGYLTGQAYVDLKCAVEGTPVFIYQGASKQAGKAPAELNNGDKVNLPTPAMIVSRFPKL